MNPQSATPTGNIAQSDGFNAHSLPSLTTYAITADTLCISASKAKSSPSNTYLLSPPVRRCLLAVPTTTT